MANPIGKIRALLLRFRGMADGTRENEEFAAELESHIAMHTEDGVRAGLSPLQARRQALVKLGGAEQARQAYREQLVMPRLESLLRDLIFGLRTLGKHRATTAIAVLSIGLGIGANATIFSMVSRFVLQPAPVGDPSTLMAFYTTQDGGLCCGNEFSLPVYNDLRQQAKSFSGAAAYYDLLPASIGGSGEPERVWGQAVTTNFFDITQIPLLLGRGFVDGEDHQPVIVLSAGLWQRRFNGDAQIVGKPVMLSGRTFTVAGVAPAAFHSVDQILNAQFWVPLGNATLLAPSLTDQSARDFHWLSVVGRLSPGVTRAQAKAELATLAERFAQSYPNTDKGVGFVFEQAGTLPPRERDTVLLFLTALTIVVLLVLFIAGANVANILFAQVASRQRDMAVRLALGATRWRLQRRLLIESLLLGLGGGLLGVMLSLWATKSLSGFPVPAPVPLDLSIRVDWRVLLYSFVLSGISGLLLGVAPAWAASRPLLANALKGEDTLARPGRRISLRSVLVVAQIAMSVVVLCVTGLFLRSLQSAASIDIGFHSQNLLLMSVDPRVQGYKPEKTVAFLTQLEQRVAALPGVQSAVVTDQAPLSGGGRREAFSIEGQTATNASVANADLYMVEPGYFETMGIPRIAGHDFGGEDPAGTRTAIINRAFAERVFAGANPIGHHVSGGGTTYEVIGVVGNIKSRTLGEDLRPVLYRRLEQNVGSDPSIMGYTLVVRTAGNAALIKETVRQQIHLLDPNMAVYNQETMAEHLRSAFFLPHLAAALFGTFGCIGMVLASVGLYGVMSFVVSRRTREIGIRMAMGAQPGRVERLVLRQGLLLTIVGLALGWPVAWILSKFSSSFLYGIHPHDAFTFAVIPPFLFTIAVVACWVPARRAASVDPMQALRAD